MQTVSNLRTFSTELAFTCTDSYCFLVVFGFVLIRTMMVLYFLLMLEIIDLKCLVYGLKKSSTHILVENICKTHCFHG